MEEASIDTELVAVKNIEPQTQKYVSLSAPLFLDPY